MDIENTDTNLNNNTQNNTSDSNENSNKDIINEVILKDECIKKDNLTDDINNKTPIGYNLIECNFYLNDKMVNFNNSKSKTDYSNCNKSNKTNEFDSQEIMNLISSLEDLKEKTSEYLQKVMETNNNLGANTIINKEEQGI